MATRSKVLVPLGSASMASALWYSSAAASSPNSSASASAPSALESKHGWTMACAASSWPKSLGSGPWRQAPATPEACGEDAFAIVENDHQLVLAVADGVGSWRSKGVDPAQFSRALMAGVETTVRGEAESGKGAGGLMGRLMGSGDAPPGEALPPGAILKGAFWRLLRSYFRGAARPFGSSTACIVSLERATGTLASCNLGDSGYLVIRAAAGEDPAHDASDAVFVVARSVSQQHRFNAPFQLMLTPEGDVNDCCQMAAIDRMELRNGDLVIVASDGLWDNLFEEGDILPVVREQAVDKNGGGSAVVDPQRLAHALVQRARAASEREDYESPFALEARRHGLRRLGGKVDDITVVVGRVIEIKE